MVASNVIAISFSVQIVMLFRAAISGRVTESAGWLASLFWLLHLGKG